MALSAKLQMSLFDAGLAPEPGSTLTILSFGGGQDSTAILYRLVFDPVFRQRYAPGRLLVVMADTGDEHPETNRHVWYVKGFCKRHGIEFHLITPDMGYHSESWQSLRGFYNKTRTCGSKAFPKTCTDRLKVQPIYRFIEAWLGREYGVKATRKAGFIDFSSRYGKIRMLIGIAKGEEKRIAPPEDEPQRWKRESIETVYPLVDYGMDRKACQDYIRSVGERVPPPSNCILCPFLSEIELVWLYRFMREDYEDWCRIEAEKLKAWEHKGDRNLGVWGKRRLPEVLAGALEKYGHMSDDELHAHKFSHGHCVQSRY